MEVLAEKFNRCYCNVFNCSISVFSRPDKFFRARNARVLQYVWNLSESVFFLHFFSNSRLKILPSVFTQDSMRAVFARPVLVLAQC